jgi:hypothetical protein
MEDIDLTGIVPFYGISEFLRINDQPKKIGISLVDEDDKLIDCNIYHPKYGSIKVHNEHGSFEVRLGFVTREQGAIVTSCSHIYRSYYTGELVYCQFQQHTVLCTHEDGTFTNKDGIKVLERDFIAPQSHTAETIADFEKVFLREFKKSSIQSKSFFIDHELLKRFTEDYVMPIEKGFYKTHGRDLEIAYSFISWLKTLTPETMPRSGDDVLFNEEIIRKVHNHNGNAFNNISETDLHKALNDPAKFGSLIVKKNQSKLIGIIKHLEALSTKEWTLMILKATAIDTEIYRKKATSMARTIKFD